MIQFTYDCWTSYNPFEALFIPLIDIERELMPNVGASTYEKKDHRQERLKIEKSWLYSKLVSDRILAFTIFI